MKRQEPKPAALTASGGSLAPSLAELRALRQARKATSQRVEELKLKLFRITERHMDQTVGLIRRWMDDKN